MLRVLGEGLYVLGVGGVWWGGGRVERLWGVWLTRWWSEVEGVVLCLVGWGYGGD